MFTLLYRDSDGTPRSHPLPAGDTIVGRGAACDVVINHTSVSRQHARITVRQDKCFVADLGSARGTWRGDTLLVGEAELRDGEAFRVGLVEMSVTMPAVAVGVALTDDREIVDPSATIYQRVDRLIAEDGASAAPIESARLLKLLSDIGKTLVTVQPLTQVLDRVVDVVFDVVAADRAYLLLRESADRSLTGRVMRQKDGRTLEQPAVSRTVVDTVMRDRVAMLASDALTDQRLSGAASLHAMNIRSFMCAPLWNQNDVIGVLYVDNPRSRKFSDDDLTVFTALSNYAAVAIDQARLAERAADERRRRERLERYHSPDVVKRILTADAGGEALVAQEREATVMFCDLVGFTSMTEELEPRAVAGLLNEFFEAMTDEIFARQGTLDKFIGDAILAVFGAPFDDPDHTVHAVEAALAMRGALATLNARRPDRRLQIRTAIHTGRVLTGDIGSSKRREFTILGDTVNTTSRLQTTVARAGQIIVSRDAYDRLAGRFAATPLGAVELRGRRSAIEAFRLD